MALHNMGQHDMTYHYLTSVSHFDHLQSYHSNFSSIFQKDMNKQERQKQIELN